MFRVAILAALSVAVSCNYADLQNNGRPRIVTPLSGVLNVNLPGNSGGAADSVQFASVKDIVNEAVSSGSNVVNAQSVRAPILVGSISPSEKVTPEELQRGISLENPDDVTITVELTRDHYSTYTNLFYNTVPITLTEFQRNTVVAPTAQVVATPRDDSVLVSTAPVTITDAITVTDTSTEYQYVTEVSTEVYTVTHRTYDIRQQVITSYLTETQLFRPAVVSTLITTRIDTSYVTQTVSNTVFVDSPRPGSTSFGSSGSSSGGSLFDVRSSGISDFAVRQGLVDQRYNQILGLQNDLIQVAGQYRELSGLLVELRNSKLELENSRNLPLEARLRFLDNFSAVQQQRIRFVNDFLGRQISAGGRQGVIGNQGYRY